MRNNWKKDMIVRGVENTGRTKELRWKELRWEGERNGVDLSLIVVHSGSAPIWWVVAFFPYSVSCRAFWTYRFARRFAGKIAKRNGLQATAGDRSEAWRERARIAEDLNYERFQTINRLTEQLAAVRADEENAEQRLLSIANECDLSEPDIERIQKLANKKVGG